MAASKWATKKKKKSEEDLLLKVRGPDLGSKIWWTLVKGKQGYSHLDSIPSSQDRTVQWLPEVSTFHPAHLVQQSDTVTRVTVTTKQVEQMLRGLETKKATGSDNINPQLLIHCAKKVGCPLTKVFSTCLWENVTISVEPGKGGSCTQELQV